MVCYQPLKGWLVTDGDDRGKVRGIPLPGHICLPIDLPCGKCLGCRMEYARQWAIRCVHEAELHDQNCMVTLTYDEKHLPMYGELQPRDVQLWLKRLRKNYPERRIKFFLAGEYGSENQRPHYHALLFGIDFQTDLWYNKTDQRPPQSELQRSWEHGHVHVAPLTYETAAYVARYCLKKQEKSGDIIDKSTGVILRSEFTRMSRRPGIAGDWIKANNVDTYKDDTIIVQGSTKSRPPRYYDKMYIKIKGENSLDKIKRKRLEESFLRRADNTPERLSVREKVAKARQLISKRSYENG